MTDIITARQTDSKLQNIRQYVAAKNGKIPFLLLPVRIEARFMKVDVPVLSGNKGLYEKLLEKVGILELELENPLPRMSVPARQKYLNTMTIRLKEIREEADRLAEINRQEKDWLSQSVKKIQETLTIQARLVRSPELRSLQGVMINETSSVLKAVTQIKVKPDNAFDDANTYLSQIKTLNQKFKNIIEGKIPYTNKKNKKQLYGYIEKLFDNLEHFYRPVDDKASNIRRIKNNQLSAINALHEELKQMSQMAPARLLQVHPNDTAWKKFIDRISQRDKNLIKGGMDHFDRVILQKLKFTSEIRHISVSQLFYKSLRTWMAVERFNNTKKTLPSDELVKFSKELSTRLQTLQNMTEKVLDCDDVQFEQLGNFWERLDDSLSKYQKITTPAPTGRNPGLTGRNPVLNLNIPVRTRLSQRLKPLSGKAAFIDGKTYTESQNFFFSADANIKKIIGMAGNNTLSKESLQDRLAQIVKDISIASRKKLLASEKQFQKTSELINRMNDTIKGSSLISDSELKNKMDRIREGLAAGSIRPDLRLPNFGDRPIVVARPTIEENQLWVRIFPDDIHVHTHEKELTEEEIKDGKNFWNAWWAASDDKNLESGAWKALVASQGSSRAAWIAKLLDPKKLRSNRLLISNKPGKTVLQAIQFVNETSTVLKNVNEKSQIDTLFNAFDSSSLIQKLHLVYRRIAGIRYEQISFMQQFLSELQRLETKLIILQNKINAAPSALLMQHTTEINQIQSAFSVYGDIQTVLQSIEVLDTSRYLARLEKKLNFPSVAQKEGDWTVAPHSKVLPGRFVVLAMNGDKYEHIAVGNPVPDKLHLGLDPKKFDFDTEMDNPYQLDDDGNLKVDDGMKWMVDFEEAVTRGMGLKITLTRDEMEKGFDRILVLGVSDRSQTTDKQLLEELIENHHYSPEGLGILPVGTATNNTSGEGSGYTSLDKDPEESYRVEMGNPLFLPGETNPLLKADGQRLAEALGINPAVLQNIVNSDGRQVSRAMAMHRSLWHATIGDYLESGWDYVFTYDNMEKAFQYFKDNVVTRGILPSIRVGSQPYGILPTTAFSKLKFHNTFDDQNLPQLSKDQINNPSPAVLGQLQVRFDIRLKKLLLLLKEIWAELHKLYVKHAYNLPDEADGGDLNTLPSPQQHFMEMLGLQATSIEHYFRYGINIAYRGPDIEGLGFNANYTSDSSFGPVTLQTMFFDVLKEGYFHNSFLFKDEQTPVANALAQATNVANRISTQFSKSRIFKSRFLDKHTTISGQIIDSQELSKNSTLERNINGTSYIQWLLQGANSLYDILERNDFNILPSNSMLFLLLRQSLLLAYREAAMGIMQKEEFFTEDFRRLIGASDRYRLFNSSINKFVYTSKWTFLFRDPKTFNGLEGIDFSKKTDGTSNLLFQHLNNGDRSLADFLLNKSNLFNSYPRHHVLQPYLDRVDEIREAMAVLDTIPTFELNQLLAEHMDLMAYRLDSWILGLANRRLRENRTGTGAQGIFLGAYGWIEDLRPGGVREEAASLPDELNPADRSPVYTDADNEGFIHAPSLNQAIAAAVLRSGYMASRDSIGDQKNQMAVNLSSARVRNALQLVEGVNSGQSLGAVLGYQFEKGLHERYNIVELDRFIYGFRRKFPLVVPLEITTDESDENPQVQVINGIALLESVDSFIDTVFSTSNTDASIFELLDSLPFDEWPSFIHEIVDEGIQPGDNRAEILRAIAREIDQISDAMDSLGDLVISESVYQVVQGNHVRAAAVVEALAGGKSIPELQFVNTPRTGVVVTHRAVLHFDRITAGTTAAPSGWPAVLSPRAKAEPSVNQWLAKVIGPSGNIHCVVIHETGGIKHFIDITILNLGLQPIDLLYLLGFVPEQGSSELENRVFNKVIQDHVITPEDNLQISFEMRLDEWDTAEKTIYEITPLIQHLRDLLNNRKYADANEIKIPDDEPEMDNPGKLETSDLESRVDQAEKAFRKLVGDAQSLVDTQYKDVEIQTATFVTSQIAELRDYLFKFCEYGASDALPSPAVETNDEVGRELLRKLLNTLKNAGKRLTDVDKQLLRLTPATNEKQKVEILLNVGRKIFGRYMIMLPHYQPENKTAILEQLNLTADKALLRHRTDPHVLNDWLLNLSDIRPQLYAFDMCHLFCEAFGNEFPDWKPVQFPFTEGDYWLGLEYPESYTPSGDYLSVLLFDHTKLTGPGELKTGMIIDEWTEIIPGKQEVTGVAFHYDQPDAMAPQNLLLAVNPEVNTNWAWDNLVHTLNETLDLAKIRAVEPDHIEKSKLAQVLPMVVSEVAPPQLRDYDDNIDDSEDKPFSNPLGTQVVMDFADNLTKKDE